MGKAEALTEAWHHPGQRPRFLRGLHQFSPHQIFPMIFNPHKAIPDSYKWSFLANRLATKAVIIIKRQRWAEGADKLLHIACRLTEAVLLQVRCAIVETHLRLVSRQLVAKSPQNAQFNKSWLISTPLLRPMMDGTLLEISFPEKHKTANICKLYLHRSANIIDKYAGQNAFWLIRSALERSYTFFIRDICLSIFPTVLLVRADGAFYMYF